MEETPGKERGKVREQRARCQAHAPDAAEWAVRTDLAACYRLAANFRTTDLVYAHISARVPGPEPHCLINAYGLLFDEITASRRVNVTLGGEIVADPTGLGINPVG